MWNSALDVLRNNFVYPIRTNRLIQGLSVVYDEVVLHTKPFNNIDFFLVDYSAIPNLGNGVAYFANIATSVGTY